jgi:hypothetical protein
MFHHDGHHSSPKNSGSRVRARRMKFVCGDAADRYRQPHLLRGRRVLGPEYHRRDCLHACGGIPPRTVHTRYPSTGSALALNTADVAGDPQQRGDRSHAGPLLLVLWTYPQRLEPEPPGVPASHPGAVRIHR